MKMRYCKPVIAGLLVSLVAGCAIPPQGAGGANNASSDPCSVGRTAVAGAAVGALIGALAGGTKGALIGAAAGGAVGSLGCYAVNVHSRQVKTAAQVDSQYMAQRGGLPPSPEVVTYTVSVSDRVVRDQWFRVNTSVEIVNGRYQPVHSVEEHIVLMDPEGKPFKNGSKPLETKSASAGSYENYFELKLPKGVSQGVYPMRADLYVNGNLAASRDMHTQLVMEDGHAMLVATR